MIWKDYNYIAAAIGIGLLALLMRLVYLEETAQSPLSEVPVAAGKVYAEVARGEPESVRAPLYPLWLRASGLGNGMAAAARLQAVLGAVSCAVLALVGRVLLGPWFALIAAFCAALYGPAIYFSGQLVPQVVSVLLTLALLAGLLWADRGSLAWPYAGPGFLLGICVFMVPPVLFFAPVGLWWLWLGGRRWGCLAFALGLAAALILVAGVIDGAAAVLGPERGSLYLLWSGAEYLPDLDMYYGRGESLVLTILLWQWGIAFPFGLVAPLGFAGMAFVLVTRERTALLILLFITACTVGVGLWGGHSEIRIILAFPTLLLAIFGMRKLIESKGLKKLGIVLALVVVGVLLNQDQAGLARAAEVSQQRWLGYAYEELGMRASAIAAYEEVVASGNGPREAYWSLAELYNLEGKSDRALGAYRALVGHSPTDREARRVLGDSYMRMSRPQEAKLVYRQLAAEGEEIEVLGRLGDAYLMSGEIEEAANEYEKLLALRPDSSRVRYQLARVHAAEGRVDQAQEAYRLLLDDPLWRLRSSIDLGALLAGVGQLGAAEAILMDALALERDHPEAHLLLGEVFFKQQRFEEALRHGLRYTELDPQDWKIHGFLSKIYGRLNRIAEASEARMLYQRHRRKAEIHGRLEAERKALMGKLLGEE